MPPKSGDSGKSRVPGSPKKKGDTGKIKKPSAKLARPDKGKSARRPRDDEDEGDDERAAPPRKQGMSAGKAFLICTPITMVLMLAVGYKLWSMPDAPDKPAVIKIDYDELVQKARGKYSKAKMKYDEAVKLDDTAKAVSMLKEARAYIQSDEDPSTLKTKPFDEVKALADKNLGAQQIIQYVRDNVEDPLKTSPGEKPKVYAFEEMDNNNAQLLIMIRKAMQER